MLRIVSRPDAAEVFADCYAERSGELPRDVLLQRLHGWDVAVIQNGGQVIGAIARKAGEFHFGILPEYRGKWATQSGMNLILQWAGESGQVKTSAAFGSLGDRLAKFVGMRVTRATEKGSHYVYP